MRAESMIGKVARAIAANYGDGDWQSHVAAARAAVAAMREPTVEVLDAVLPDLPDWSYLIEDWRAIIDYAAAEPLH